MIDLSDTIVFQPAIGDTLPRLRFEDGEVVIKTHATSTHWLLLHKSVIDSNVPMLAAMLRWPGGDRPQSIMHPITGIDTIVHKLSLTLADETFVISDTLNPILPGASCNSENGPAFYESELSSGWPKCSDLSYKREERSIEAHRILFALIYGYPLSLKAIDEWLKMTSQEHKTHEMSFAIAMVSLTGAYAEYYECLSSIALSLYQMLSGHPVFWQWVTGHPSDSLRLAAKLRVKELYFDALRHLLAQAARDRYMKISEVLDMDTFECRAWAEPIIQKMYSITNCLRDQLHRLQLVESWSTYSSVQTFVRSTIQNVLDINPPRNRDMLNARYQAGMIFGQWFAQNLSGERLYIGPSGKPRHDDGGSLGWAIQSLERASTWEFPAAVFGKGVIKTHVKFCTGSKYHARKQIERTLNELVEEAADLAQDHLGVCDEEVDGVTYTHRRTKEIDKFEDPTYFSLDESDVPWKNQEAWKPAVGLGEESTTPASAEWLASLGMEVEKDDDFIEEQGAIVDALGNAFEETRIGNTYW